MNTKTLIGLSVFALSISALAADAANTQSPSAPSAPSDDAAMNRDIERGTTQNGMRSPASSGQVLDQNRPIDQSRGAMEASKNLTEMSPTDVCKRIVDIQKMRADTQMDQLVLRDRMSKGKGSMEQHRGWLRQEISSGQCQNETIAGNHAFVVVKTGERERFVPFVRESGIWKLDPQAFKTLYRTESRVPASK